MYSSPSSMGAVASSNCWFTGPPMAAIQAACRDQASHLSQLSAVFQNSVWEFGQVSSVMMTPLGGVLASCGTTLLGVVPASCMMMMLWGEW